MQDFSGTHSIAAPAPPTAHAHSLMLTLIHTHIHAHTHTHMHTRACSYSHTDACSFYIRTHSSRSHSYTRVHLPSNAHTLARLTLILAHTHTRARAHAALTPAFTLRFPTDLGSTAITPSNIQNSFKIRFRTLPSEPLWRGCGKHPPLRKCLESLHIWGMGTVLNKRTTTVQMVQVMEPQQ